MSDTRVSAITKAFRARAAAVSGVEIGDEKAEATEEAAATTEEEVDDLPDMSWKKDDIVDYLVRNEVVESEDDVKGLTKAELLENFFDDEG